jgi:hypothetical protein
MGLSFVAMGAATFGLLSPVVGALVQEGIDVAAILNALRALRDGPEAARPHLPADVAARLRGQHRALIPGVDQLRELADSIDDLPVTELWRRIGEVRDSLVNIVAHERMDEDQVYRTIAATLGGDDPLAAMSRTHQEIFHLARMFERLVANIPAEGPDAGDRIDLRRTLYALHTVLRLNISQEEQLYLSLDRDATATTVEP